MASATKKKKVKSTARTRGKRVPGKVTAVRQPATKSAEPITEPERAAPQLAEVDGDVLEFIEAIDRFKKQNGRPFPSWSEVLLVLRRLGYRRR
ncbi:MAG TPA: hypothetical protein VFZ65_04170 [Planctomycetota bacterium]|nr:hypothetical protein [Planctomycetota bacterium]